jgi:hypothetical protein
VRVRFRTYCQGCRYGTRAAMPLGQRRNVDGPAECREFCVWRAHRYEWEYIISAGDLRLRQRKGFTTREAAMESAAWSWSMLAEVFALHRGE